jgi:hypothetical protein
MIIIVVVKPTDIRLVDSLGDTKIVFKRAEISPTAVIGKGLPLAVGYEDLFYIFEHYLKVRQCWSCDWKQQNQNTKA